MSTGAIIGLVAAVIVVLAVLFFVLRPAMQRKKLRDRFGPEYDRAVSDSDSRTAAEKELAEREHRHSEFDLKPLSPSAPLPGLEQQLDAALLFFAADLQ